MEKFSDTSPDAYANLLKKLELFSPDGVSSVIKERQLTEDQVRFLEEHVRQLVELPEWTKKDILAGIHMWWDDYETSKRGPFPETKVSLEELGLDFSNLTDQNISEALDRHAPKSIDGVYWYAQKLTDLVKESSLTDDAKHRLIEGIRSWRTEEVLFREEIAAEWVAAEAEDHFT